MNIYYSLEYKSKGLWLIWKNIEGNNSFNCICVFEGTKEDCKGELKKYAKRRIYN